MKPIHWLAALAVLLSASSAASAQKPDNALVLDVLKAGGWSTNADDTTYYEQLPMELVRKLTPASLNGPYSETEIRNLGLLAMTLAAAEWGVKDAGPGLDDPGKNNWAGPPPWAGKHLMSYNGGGIGLPHYDAANGPTFFNYVVQLVPASAKDLQPFIALGKKFEYDQIRAQGGVCSKDTPPPTLMVDLAGEAFPKAPPRSLGAKYCSDHKGSDALDTAAWQKLRHWSRVALRREDVQLLVVETWLAKTWRPAYDAVMAKPGGSLAEAFIIARVSNSGDYHQVLEAAGTETDPATRITRELNAYAKMPKQEGKQRTNRCRAGVMQRPAAVLGLTTVPTVREGSDKACMPKS